MDISRTSFSYQPDKRKDEPVIKALMQLAEQKPTYGFGMMFDVRCMIVDVNICWSLGWIKWL
jgi:hypothetical protein